MFTRNLIAVSLAGSLLVAAPAVAQNSVVNRAVLQQTMASAAAADQANRDVVRQALARTDVRDMARQLGVDLVAAERALGAMSSEELRELAKPAQAIVDHTGGERVVVISLTTLLLGIIILLLLVD